MHASASPSPAGALELDRVEITSRVQKTFASPGYRPPMLPAVALEVIEMSQKTDVDFERVVRLLEKDPVLAAKVLSIAQSAAYATRTPILSLRTAVVRLGLKTLRDIVLEAALHLKVFRVPGFEPAMARLARHSTASAHAIRAVCKRTRIEAEYAFLCGLLHDVGFAAALLALSGDPQLGKAPWEALAPAVDEVHDEASGLLARLWKLPPQVQRVVAGHHDLGKDPEPVSAALVVAEQLVWEAGAGLEPPPPDANPMSLATPEPPNDGIDVNWTGMVEQARRELAMDDLAFGAARAEVFALVAQLGKAKA